jgi:hypothetical protein
MLTAFTCILAQIWMLLADPRVPRELAAQALHLRGELVARMPDFGTIAEAFDGDAKLGEAEVLDAVMLACMGDELPESFSNGALDFFACV